MRIRILLAILILSGCAHKYNKATKPRMNDSCMTVHDTASDDIDYDDDGDDDNSSE